MEETRKVVKMTSDYWTIKTVRGNKYTPKETEQQLRTVTLNKTGTNKTVSLKTYTCPCDIMDIPFIKGELWGRNLISKTTFGEKSKLRALGVASIEFAKKSKDMIINMVDGKKITACLRKTGDMDTVCNFFKMLKRIK
jgi:hypothetical protein